MREVRPLPGERPRLSLQVLLTGSGSPLCLPRSEPRFPRLEQEQAHPLDHRLCGSVRITVGPPGTSVPLYTFPVF